MELKIRKIKEEETEYIEIGCHKRDDRINEIVRLVKMHHGSVEAYQEDTQYQIPLSEIYYIEAVDEKTFIYLEKECYESRKRLYEFEELLANRKFARISKSVVVNMMKIVAIKPALNGRFICQLKNNEDVIISRKYVPDIKEKIKR
jgi:DNA-binding LytR/AlgR family response regulator